VTAAGVEVLTFEGLQNLEPVGSFFSEGTGGNGSGPGPDFGISFSSNALALIDAFEPRRADGGASRHHQRRPRFLDRLGRFSEELRLTRAG
jgi:hypothetical protein